MEGWTAEFFHQLIQHFRWKTIDDVKQLVTSENVMFRDYMGDGVLSYICMYYKVDDGDVIRYFVQQGATLELDSHKRRWSPLHKAACRGRGKMTRALIDLGIPVDIHTEYNQTPLMRTYFYDSNFESAKVLIDAGANLSVFNDELAGWVKEFVATREQTRAAAVIVLALQRCRSAVVGCGNGRDVLKMVARCVWSTRGWSK